MTNKNTDQEKCLMCGSNLFAWCNTAIHDELLEPQQIWLSFCDNKKCNRYKLVVTGEPYLEDTPLIIQSPNWLKPKDWITHPAQIAILELAKNEDISKMSLRAIGERIGVDHPQKVQHHLKMLVKRKKIVIKKD